VSGTGPQVQLQEPHATELGIPGVAIDATGLQVTGNLRFDDWERVGAHLGALRDLTSWALGDWIIAGEALFGERAAQGVEATGRSKATLLEYARVARQVPRSRRRPGLSFTHHQLLAAKAPAEQVEWLDRAEANRWSVEELRGMLHDPALSTRRNQSRARVELVELLEDVARAVLRAAEAMGDGFARVPEHVLDRLANALGEERP
jgi:hypothetical protein